MDARYEYEFVRLGEGMLQVKKFGREHYEEIVHQYACEGWRLVQIFAPAIGVGGHSKYYELIFEKEIKH